MVNAPTNNEMNANTSSAVEKIDRDWLTAVVFSFITVCPVTTCFPDGKTAAMARWTAGVLAPAGGVVRRPVVGDAGDGERPRRPGREDPDPLPHGEVVLAGGPGVHDHVS